ncbi:hypothetical protein E3T28_03550 [Cryobacterium sinapicolor]|uniref:DUF2993 domain-containing protein n=1 Tax=Cryobacterium sinapicolor TaxID=1259236 RepID=A0ABY2JEC1_9MICO|nr:hypothetical protein [Cryobacterium sinapicolor]TFD03904.1 hypothetical protein E3T28_03550 [Cryobacterium sinapicolor]
MSNQDGRRRRNQRRAIAAVVVIAALLGAGLVATIGSLNRDLYSAGSFVGQYLGALARQDTASALLLPGVRPTAAELEAAALPKDLPDTLLRNSVLGELTDIRLTGDDESADGRHTIEYGFRLNGTPATMTFQVESAGSFFGVFDSWRFTTSPLAVLRVNVLHQSTFSVNKLTLDTRAHAADDDAPAAFSNQAAYLAFAPAQYTFEHTSTLLDAAPQTVPVVVSGVTDVTVDAQPNAQFIGQVQAELDRFLDDCTTQQVLQPSNCPFGIEINDRVRDDPIWSIAEYPPVTLAAGDTTFEMPDTEGQAHIVVEVQSLFDGEIEVRDEDVSFAVAISVTVNPDGSLALQLR